MKRTEFTVTGHTGCMGTKANSLESIVTAAQSGATIVEFDLRYSADGTPVLSHDAPVGGEVTLDEAFATVKGFADLQVNVDVKDTSHLEKVLPLAEKHGLTDRFFYTGIFEKDVDAVKQKSPCVKYYLNAKVRKLQTKRYLRSLVKRIQDCGALGINFNHKNATKKLLDTFRSNGLQVSVWTVDKPDDMRRVIALSPDNITTRHPDELLKIIEK